MAEVIIHNAALYSDAAQESLEQEVALETRQMLMHKCRLNRSFWVQKRIFLLRTGTVRNTLLDVT